MPLSVRRHKRKKQIRYRNKKKIRRRQVKAPNVNVSVLKNAWDNKKSVQKNFLEMGLSMDPNKTIGKRIKKKRKSQLCVKMAVSEQLQQEAKAPRVKRFKLPTPQVNYLTYLVKKYGDDYKAMARDPKNVYQETWKKIRLRIQQFKKLTQYKNFFGLQSLAKDNEPVQVDPNLLIENAENIVPMETN